VTTILITGATGRIGTCLTRHFRGIGWDVAAVSRSEENLETLEQSTQGPGHLLPIVADLAKPGAIQAVTSLGTVDHLVNNARDIRTLRSTDAASWAAEFHIGVIVANELTRTLAASGGLRSVVNVSSMYGVVAVNPNLYEDPSKRAPAQYGVVKSALIHLTRELAVALAPEVRVNAVSYGGVEGRVDDTFRARYAAMVPSGRMLGDADIPGPIAFLTSPEATAVTGHNLVADGGWSTW
jgi:NAD(P)-dependent dehydrogenase (short-subunit alcohol dehydrogenase family)